MKFRTTVELGGKTATGLAVPDDVVARLNKGRRPPVAVTINGFTYRTTIASMGGVFMVPLSAENRTAAKVSAGDDVDVEVELDTAPRTVTPPADLVAALDAAPDAKAFFDGLAYTHAKEYVRWIEEAKRAETRESRIHKAIEMLRHNQTRT